MTLFDGPLLPLVALVWPLCIGVAAALPAVRQRALQLLPLAPLPALWLALHGIEGQTLVPDLLLGVTLGAERPAALLLALTAILWFAAAIHAQGSMAGARKPAVFTGFWCLTLAGNLGVFLAQDVVTFYVAFAAVSLSAYFLVVHEGTASALHAGLVYAILAMLGEVCLLMAFVIGAANADSLMISDIRETLSSMPMGGLATVLLVAGFGIKAGVMPLHVWLPLAHPAAPTAASAVLSGAIVKAGLVGLMVFLPTGAGAGQVLVALGFVTAFAGAIFGLRVCAPKAILAYSTISQMGLIVALAGAAVQTESGDFAGAAYYALHHGLAKGALFLGVAAFAAAAGRWRIAVMLTLGLIALSVAGAPITGGGLTKAAAKSNLNGVAGQLLTFSAVTTTLLLVWFLHRLSGEAPRPGARRPQMLVALPTLVLALMALILPWWLWGAWSGLPPDYPLRLATIWSALWPVALGFVLVGPVAATRWPGGSRMEADPFWWARRIVQALGPLGAIPRQLGHWRGAAVRRVVATAMSSGALLAVSAEAAERHFLAWRVTGLIMLGMVLLFAALVTQ